VTIYTEKNSLISTIEDFVIQKYCITIISKLSTAAAVAVVSVCVCVCIHNPRNASIS
jgi:hypothetical protein